MASNLVSLILAFVGEVPRFTELGICVFRSTVCKYNFIAFILHPPKVCLFIRCHNDFIIKRQQSRIPAVKKNLSITKVFNAFSRMHFIGDLRLILYVLIPSVLFSFFLSAKIINLHMD